MNLNMIQEKDFSALFAHFHKSAKFETDYEEAGPGFDRRLVIRRYYRDALPEIMSLAKTNLSMWYSKYPFDWRFNKNEKSLCSSICHRPMAMYPEFPVLNYFVDFGNPFLQIAIEADSKTFHDKGRDTERDHNLLQEGWKTFRVSYKENFEPFVGLGEIAEMILDESDEDASDEMEKWMLNTSDGVVDAIYFFYFMSAEERVKRMKKYPDYLSLAERTLEIHRYVDFGLPDPF